jgi:hypothetical protein
MLGFAPSPAGGEDLSRHVGSLPIGLSPAGACCSSPASARAAAAVVATHYLADATVTLLRRIVRRDVLAAHRSHFYQRATDNGFPVWRW